MTDLSTVLPVSAALLHLTGFTLYNVQAKLGKSDPNPASWFLWAFLATMNALSFRAMNDTIAALQFFAGSIGCIVTFIYVLAIGHLRIPTKREYYMMILGAMAIGIWHYQSATAANMILTGILIWCFEPTLRGVWNDPTKEKATAWYLWATAFAITGVNTYFYRGGWTLSMIIPIVGFVCHILVPALCTKERKRVFATQSL